MKENRQRVLGRMYQKKLIERREKQMKILNRQLNEISDSDSLPYAFAAHGESRFDPGLPNELSVYDSTQSAQAKQSGLETLRKVQDSLGQRKKQPRLNQAATRRAKQKRNHQKALSKLAGSLNSSIEEDSLVQRLRLGGGQMQVVDYNALSSYQSLACNNESSRTPIAGAGRRRNQQQAQSTGPVADQLPLADQGVGEHAGHLLTDERGGAVATSNCTSEEDAARMARNFSQEDRQAAQVGSVHSGSKEASNASAEKPRSRNWQKAFATSNFARKPRVRAPQYWQGVIERKFNMIQTEEETVFVPGRVCRSVYRTAPQ